MSDPLDVLDAPSRRTVEAYIRYFRDRNAVGFGELFAEEGTFEGAFSGGILQGRANIETHFRMNVRRFFTDGMVEFHDMAIQGRQVVLEWELLRPSEGGIQSASGRTILELDEDGLLEKAKAEWDPTGLLR